MMLRESWEVLITSLALSIPLTPILVMMGHAPLLAFQGALVLSAAGAAMVYDLTTPRSRRFTWRGE